MNYGEQVLARLAHPGLLLLIAGAAVTYGSAHITRRFSSEKANLLCKGIGCIVAVAGAVWLFV